MAEASIECPAMPAFELEDLEHSMDAGSSAGSASGSHSAPAQERSDEGQRLVHLGCPTAIPSSGSTTSSPSSGSGASSASATTLGSATAAMLNDADVVRWVAGEQRLSLPTPPGNDLLRPPQGV